MQTEGHELTADAEAVPTKNSIWAERHVSRATDESFSTFCSLGLSVDYQHGGSDNDRSADDTSCQF
jgi:hypothetical protein